MSEQDQAMPRAYPPFWIGLTSGGALFLAGFIVWAALFGFGIGHSPNEQQASRAPATEMRGGQPPQTTGQGAATQPAQPQEQK